MAETTTEMLTPGGGVTETSLHWADYIVIVLYFLAVLVVSSLEETSTFYIYTNIHSNSTQVGVLDNSKHFRVGFQLYFG